MEKGATRKEHLCRVRESMELRKTEVNGHDPDLLPEGPTFTEWAKRTSRDETAARQHGLQFSLFFGNTEQLSQTGLGGLVYRA